MGLEKYQVSGEQHLCFMRIFQSVRKFCCSSPALDAGDGRGISSIVSVLRTLELDSEDPSKVDVPLPVAMPIKPGRAGLPATAGDVDPLKYLDPDLARLLDLRGEHFLHPGGAGRPAGRLSKVPGR